MEFVEFINLFNLTESALKFSFKLAFTANQGIVRFYHFTEGGLHNYLLLGNLVCSRNNFEKFKTISLHSF